MSHDRPLSFEETQTMRAAIDMVMRTFGDDIAQRAEVARNVLAFIVAEPELAASKLANRTLRKMGFSHVIADDGEERAVDDPEQAPA